MADPRKIEKNSFIIDTESGGICHFQMMPEVVDSKSVNWNQIEIVGRSHPILGYASSAPRTFSFTLTFFAHPSKEDGTTQAQIVENIRFLMSLAYPDYSGGIRPPHKCVLKLGDMISWSVVCQDVSVNYHPLWKNNLPVHAEVTLTFVESANEPISYSMVRSGAASPL